MEWQQVQDARDQGMTDQLRHQRNEIAKNGCEEGKPNYKMTVIKSEWTSDTEHRSICQFGREFKLAARYHSLPIRVISRKIKF